MKAGDWISVLVGLLLVVFLFPFLWENDSADKALIRREGKVFAEVSLEKDQTVSVPGPLGISRIKIAGGQARVEADPGPRQYCVKQGWLKNAGDVAICLPNQVSLELQGRNKRYDSVNY